MLERRTIFEIHRLAREGASNVRIAELLMVGRETVAKYLADPEPQRKTVTRTSKLDPFRQEILDLLAQNPKASAEVIRQRLTSRGFTGKNSILKEYLRTVRPRPRRACIRFESEPGEQFQIDWGHFGALTYGATTRKLYCLAVTECHSRMLYIEFTHSQRQETLHRGLINAFRFFGGTPRDLVHDNMLTAVIERQDPLIRYNEAFLAFLRPLKITPKACHPYSPQEKGKVEKGVVHYVRHNFWPLRAFRDLADVQTQADEWRDAVANLRLHATTGERPADRLRRCALTPLPALLPDCLDTAQVTVHVDCSVRFDANTYTVPPWAVGKIATVKADHRTVRVMLREKTLATHVRSWERNQRIELPEHRDATIKSQRRQWRSQEVAALVSMGDDAREYLERLAGAASIPLKKDVARLLILKDRYGADALVVAIQRALRHNALGAAAVENILRQSQSPPKNHPPLRFEEDRLNRIRLEEPNLAEYDAILCQGVKNDRKS